jgi:hypothetical protein
LTFCGLVLGAVGAILAWLTTEFVGRPFRRFFDLRGEVARRLVQFADVRARRKMTDDTQAEHIPLSPAEEARLTEAENTFRDLASQMRAFTQAEPVAAWIVRHIFTYDAFEASASLIGYSNRISEYAAGRAYFKDRIENLLRIRTV